MKMEVVDGEDGRGEGVPVYEFCFVSPVSDGIACGEIVGSLVAGSKSNASLQKHIYNCK
jgi:hypothetical protein